MGDRLTEEEKKRQASPTPYGDIFDELFPHYLAMGMTPEQYWDGESELKPAYRKAYGYRIENEQRIADRQNWYMGQYIISALQAVPLLVAGLNVKEGTRLPEYPEMPFFQKAEEQKKEEVRKQKEEDQRKLAMAMLQASFERFNKNFLKKQAEQKARGQTGQ